MFLGKGICSVLCRVWSQKRMPIGQLYWCSVLNEGKQLFMSLEVPSIRHDEQHDFFYSIFASRSWQSWKAALILFIKHSSAVLGMLFEWNECLTPWSHALAMSGDSRGQGNTCRTMNNILALRVSTHPRSLEGKPSNAFIFASCGLILCDQRRTIRKLAHCLSLRL